MQKESNLHSAISKKLLPHVERIKADQADDLDFLPAVFHVLLESNQNLAFQTETRHVAVVDQIAKLQVSTNAMLSASDAKNTSFFESILVEQKNQQATIGETLTAYDAEHKVQLSSLSKAQLNQHTELVNAIESGHSKVSKLLNRTFWIVGSLSVANLLLLGWLLVRNFQQG